MFPSTPSEIIRFLETVQQQDDSRNENSDLDDYDFRRLLWCFPLFVIACLVLVCRFLKARVVEQEQRARDAEQGARDAGQSHQLAQRQAASLDRSHQRIAQELVRFYPLNVGSFLSNLDVRPDIVEGGEGEEARAEPPADVMDGGEARAKRITEALEVTTFTVGENDIIEIEVDEESGASVLDHETAIDHTSSDLVLPFDAPNGSRAVPGGCAICLCPYEPGDIVTWSNENACQHAFHRKCIVTWLAKKNKPKCPCCRQDY